MSPQFSIHNSPNDVFPIVNTLETKPYKNYFLIPYPQTLDTNIPVLDVNSDR